MKKMLNTLYVTTQGTYLFKDGETIAIQVEQEVRMRLPIHTLESIVCFGQVTCSPFLLGHCAENEVSVSFLTVNGRFLARVTGPAAGNVLLRRAQYRAADSREDNDLIVQGFLIGKILNSMQVLRRALSDHYEEIEATAVEKAYAALEEHLRELKKEHPADVLRGIEGAAANAYFHVFDHLILQQKQDFQFNQRNRRPPLDPVNALLSFLYTLLYHDARSALESVGLDPAVGFLHRDRPGRLSLALDLMEELRPFLADRLVLSLINRRQVQGKGFKKTESGAVVMDDETRKTVLVAWQERKKEEIRHPFLEEQIPAGMILFAQARLLARYLRGELDAYPPFIWR